MPRRKRVARKGITGIEAAIVMIAFVVVAAALAFVVLNMGMFTTQRARQVIAQGLQESSSSLMVDGSVTGIVDSSGKYVELISIPIRLAGQEPVDLSTSKTSVSVITNKVAFDNWYQDVTYSNSLTINGSTVTIDPYNLTDIATKLSTNNANSGVYVFFLPDTLKNKDTVLEPGEKALVVVYFNNTNIGPGPYDSIRVEIRPPQGAPLTVDRTVPAVLPTGGAITLG